MGCKQAESLVESGSFVHRELQEIAPTLQSPKTVPTAEARSLADQDSEGIRLSEIWRAVRRHKRLVLLVGTSLFAALSAMTIVRRIVWPVYSGRFQMLITDPIAPSGGGVVEGGGIVESLARNRTNVDVPTLIQTLSSPLVMGPVAQKLGKGSAPFLQSLNVSQPASSQRASVQGVLEVKLLGDNIAELQHSLETLSKAYLQFALTQRRERIAQGLLFLDQQEPLMVAKLGQVQTQLANFRTQNNQLSPESEAGSFKQESLAMAGELRLAEAERTRLLRLRQDISSGRLTAANFISQADGVSVTQARSDLLDQLQTVEQQLTEARSVYRSDSPRVQNLVTLRNRLSNQRRSQQLEAVDTSLDQNATRTSSLNYQIKQIDRQFLKQPTLIKEYEERMQQLELAQANLNSLVTTRSTFQLELAQNILPWKLISPPQVEKVPEEPNVTKGLLNGLLLGVVAGVGAGLLRERLDNGFHDPKRVEEEIGIPLGIPLLAHIPHVAFFKGVRENKRFLLNELDLSTSNKAEAMGTTGDTNIDNAKVPNLSSYQRFFYQEAFRNLFTSIRFLNSDKQLRSLALTSSLPAEGKSLITTLLCKTISEMGQRVLLVDADMRKPQVHYRLGLNNLTGLSNLLTDPSLHWGNVMQKMNGYDNWSVLTAGTRPPDPARLLSSRRMQELVQELANSDQFDLVIFDTPPVLGISDTPLIAQHLDGLMLLVSLDRVDRSLPKEAINRVRSSGSQVLGLVTNGIKEKRSNKGVYGYSNSYDYGYGAYDSSVAYSYHVHDQGEDVSESRGLIPEGSSGSPLITWKTQASKIGRRFLNWVDK